MTRRAMLEGRSDVVVHGHGTTLGMVPEEDDVVVFVRDPVERFRSAYDHLNDGWVHDIEGDTLLDLWPSAEDLALEIETAAPVMNRQTSIFLPLRFWFDTWRQVKVYVMEQTEQAMLREFGEPLGPLQRLNASRAKSPLSMEAIRALKTFYAEDYRIMAEHLRY